MPSPVQDQTRGLWFRSQLHYQLSQTLCSLVAVFAYNIAFCALVSMNTDTFRLIKIYSEVPEDSALFKASPISIDADTAE